MSDSEVNFMILVYGPIWLITFGAIGFLVGRGLWRSTTWIGSHLRALWRRRHLKLVHSQDQVITTRRRADNLKVVDF